MGAFSNVSVGCAGANALARYPIGDRSAVLAGCARNDLRTVKIGSSIMRAPRFRQHFGDDCNGTPAGRAAAVAAELRISSRSEST